MRGIKHIYLKLFILSSITLWLLPITSLFWQKLYAQKTSVLSIKEAYSDLLKEMGQSTVSKKFNAQLQHLLKDFPLLYDLYFSSHNVREWKHQAAIHLLCGIDAPQTRWIRNNHTPYLKKYLEIFIRGQRTNSESLDEWRRIRALKWLANYSECADNQRKVFSEVAFALLERVKIETDPYARYLMLTTIFNTHQRLSLEPILSFFADPTVPLIDKTSLASYLGSSGNLVFLNDLLSVLQKASQQTKHVKELTSETKIARNIPKEVFSAIYETLPECVENVCLALTQAKYVKNKPVSISMLRFLKRYRNKKLTTQSAQTILKKLILLIQSTKNKLGHAAIDAQSKLVTRAFVIFSELLLAHKLDIGLIKEIEPLLFQTIQEIIRFVQVHSNHLLRLEASIINFIETLLPLYHIDKATNPLHQQVTRKKYVKLEKKFLVLLIKLAKKKQKGSLEKHFNKLKEKIANPNSSRIITHAFRLALYIYKDLTEKEQNYFFHYMATNKTVLGKTLTKRDILFLSHLVTETKDGANFYRYQYVRILPILDEMLKNGMTEEVLAGFPLLVLMCTDESEENTIKTTNKKPIPTAGHILNQLVKKGKLSLNQLTELTKGKNKRIKLGAAITILKIFGKTPAPAVKTLASLIVGPDKLRMEVIEALGKIGMKALPAAPLIKKIRDGSDLEAIKKADILLRKIVATGFPVLVKDLADKNEDKRKAAISVFAASDEIGEKRTIALPAIIKTLKDSHWEIRYAAICAIQKTNKKALVSAIPALTKALEDTHFEIREGAAYLLGVIGKKSTPAISALIKALKDRHPAVREKAAFALGKIGKQATPAIPALIKTLKDPHSSVREEATFALRKISKNSTLGIPFFMEALKDNHWEIRKEAAYMLGIIGKKAVLTTPALINVLEDRKFFVRGEAAHALGKIGKQAASAIPALIKALTDNRSYVREEAAYALGKIGENSSLVIPALRKSLKDPSLYVQKAAQKALKKLTKK